MNKPPPSAQQPRPFRRLDAEGAVFEAEIVAIMRDLLASQSKEGVMDALGISAATWLKIKRGQPIRRSTAENLLMRIHPSAEA